MADGDNCMPDLPEPSTGSWLDAIQSGPKTLSLDFLRSYLETYGNRLSLAIDDAETAGAGESLTAVRDFAKVMELLAEAVRPKLDAEATELPIESDGDLNPRIPGFLAGASLTNLFPLIEGCMRNSLPGRLLEQSPAELQATSLGALLEELARDEGMKEVSYKLWEHRGELARPTPPEPSRIILPRDGTEFGRG